ADRLRESRGGPGWRAARQWQRRPPPTPTRPPTSAPSGRLRLPPPHVRPCVTPYPRRFWFRPEILRHDPRRVRTCRRPRHVEGDLLRRRDRLDGGGSRPRRVL